MSLNIVLSGYLEEGVKARENSFGHVSGIKLYTNIAFYKDGNYIVNPDYSFLLRFYPNLIKAYLKEVKL